MTAWRKISYDLRAVLERDPAAHGKAEVILTYGGFQALCMYRFAHFMYLHRYRLLALMISRLAKLLTGVEIHPAAVIGYGVVIDHGTGVVIGETAEVGNNVTIYQGVTLGGTGKDRGKRHPTVCDGAVIASGAKVLGPFTVGQNARIGAGSVVLCEVPPGATVVGTPGKVVRLCDKRVKSTPAPKEDALAKELSELRDRISELEKIIKTQGNSDA